MSGRPRGRSGRRGGSQMGVVEIFTRPDYHPVTRVVGWIIRYRAELSCIAVLVTAALILRGQVGPDWATLILVGVAAIVFAIPASRRYVTRRVWCVHSRHRARSCFLQTRTMTYDGRLPFLYWSRPSPVGDRVRVWLPAGLAVKDIDNVCDELATACWARSARVEASRRFSQLGVIEIVRRDPLGAADVITPAVLDGMPTDAGTGDADVVPLPDRSTLPTPLPTPVRDGPATRPTRRSPTVPRPRDHAQNGSGNGTVTGFGGVDVSDYV
jgi:hypothetical protein